MGKFSFLAFLPCFVRNLYILHYNLFWLMLGKKGMSKLMEILIFGFIVLLIGAGVYFAIFFSQIKAVGSDTSQRITSLQDYDRDGVIDMWDLCLCVPGDTRNEGCPSGQPVSKTTDEIFKECSPDVLKKYGVVSSCQEDYEGECLKSGPDGYRSVGVLDCPQGEKCFVSEDIDRDDVLDQNDLCLCRQGNKDNQGCPSTVTVTVRPALKFLGCSSSIYEKFKISKCAAAGGVCSDKGVLHHQAIGHFDCTSDKQCFVPRVPCREAGSASEKECFKKSYVSEKGCPENTYQDVRLPGCGDDEVCCAST